MFRHRGVSDNDTAAHSRRLSGGKSPSAQQHCPPRGKGYWPACRRHSRRCLPMSPQTHAPGVRAEDRSGVPKPTSDNALYSLPQLQRLFFLIALLPLGRRVETYLGRGGGHGGGCSQHASVTALETDSRSLSARCGRQPRMESIREGSVLHALDSKTPMSSSTVSAEDAVSSPLAESLCDENCLPEGRSVTRRLAETRFAVAGPLD
ncbi:hypothetical protein MRX96_026875 [Rhipicephalus microplus]